MSNRNWEEEVETLKNELFDSEKFNLQKHDRYIALLSLDRRQNLQSIIAARKTKKLYFILSPREYSDWFEDINGIDNYFVKIDQLKDFYFHVLNDHPVVKYWGMFLKFIISDANSGIEVPTQLSQALKVCSNDYKESHIIWDIVINYYIKDYEDEESPQKFDIILKLQLKRLTYPHAELDKSFENLSAFISKYDINNYDDHMATANKIFSETKKQIPYYDEFELKLAKTPQDVDLWCSYLESIAKYSKDGDFAPIIGLFERVFASLIMTNSKRKWLPFWFNCLYTLYEKDYKERTIIEPLLIKFIKLYPDDPRTYAEHIRFTGTQEVLPRMDALDLMNKSNYNDWKLAASAILSQEFQSAKDGDENKITLLYMDLMKFCQYAIYNNNDEFHSVEKLGIEIFLELGDYENAEHWIDQMLEKFSDQCEVWLYAYEFYKTNKKVSKEFISNLFQRAVIAANAVPFLLKISDQWLNFESILGDKASFNFARIEGTKKLRLLHKIKTEKSLVEDTEQNKSKSSDSKKRKFDSVEDDDHDSQNKRSRENYSVKVTNLTDEVKENDLRVIFEECGPIREIQLISGNHQPYAILEFNDEKGVLAALTKHLKKLNNETIYVQKQEDVTVFVSNFPATFSKDQISQLFEGVGHIISIRFPSQIPNKTKRFCFIQYGSQEVAKRAVLTYNNLKVQDKNNRDYIISAAISNPEKSNGVGNLKGDAPMADRKIRLHNLPKSCTENDIANFLGQYGEVESTVFPRTSRKRVGSNNDGLAIVLLKNLATVNRICENQTLSYLGNQVAISRVKPLDDIYEYDDQASIGILNLDRTISAPQLKAFLQERVGGVKRVSIIPEVGAALAEFHKVSDAGKADMMLANARIGDNSISITTKKEVVTARHRSRPPGRADTYSTPPGRASGIGRPPRHTETFVPASVARRRR